MHVKTLSLVAAQLYIMYSYDTAIKVAVDESPEPYNKLMQIGFEKGIHDIAEDDIFRNNELAYLLEELMLCDDTCRGA